MEKIFRKPKVLGLLAISLNLIPTYWTFFFMITLPIMVLGLVFLFIKPKPQLTYQIPAGLLIGGSVFGLLLTIISIIEIAAVY